MLAGDGKGDRYLQTIAPITLPVRFCRLMKMTLSSL
jgi:hypothetical protein